MMKSFFKKLAFVMALAMVVTLAAPAGQVAMADEALAISLNGKAVESYNLEKVGDTVDFGFNNAKDGWADAGWDWTSSEPDVAAVNWQGIVTAKAEGETTITFTTMGDVATVKVTVGEVKVEEPETPAEPEIQEPETVDTTYTVTQVSDTELKVTFADKDYVADATQVELTRYYDEETFATEFLETCKAEKNVITIKPYVPFEDGDDFVIKAFAEDEGTSFTAEIGDIDEIKFTYKSKGKDGVAYAGDPEEGIYINVELNYKLLSNGVDVTNAEKHGDAYVEFELVNADAEGIILDYDGDGNPYLNFDARNLVAQIKATCYYYDEAGEAQSYTETVEIESDPAPAYTIKNRVVKWAIVKDGTALKDVNWSTKDIAVDDEILDEYYIVAVVEDAFGTQYYTNDFSDDKIKPLGSVGDSYGYEVRFTSTNPNKVIIGEDGSITTIDASSSAYAYLALYKGGEKVKNMSVLPVVVKAKRVIDKVILDPNQMKIITEGNFTTAKLTVKLEDQYDQPWIDVNGNATTVTLKPTVDYVDTLTGTYTNAAKKAEIIINAADIKADVDAANKVLSVVTFEVKAGEKKQNLKVTLKRPQYTADETVYDNKWSMEASNVDVKIDNDKDAGGIDDKKATVKIYTMTNGEKYAYADVKYFAGKKYTEVTSADVNNGDRFLVVTDKDNKVVTMTTTTSGQFELVVATTTGDGVMYYPVELGSYTATVYQASVDEDGKVTSRPVSGLSKTFAISDSTAAVTLKKQDKTHANQFANNTDDDSLANIVKAAFTFKFGDNDVKEDAAEFEVVSVKGKYDPSSDVLFVKEVELLIPLNNGDAGVVRKVTVKVGYSIQGITTDFRDELN